MAASKRLASSATTVIMFSATFFNPCCHRMRAGCMPTACRVRTDCDDRISISELRSWRAISATPPAASARPGSSAWLSDNTGSARNGDDPVAGNQFSCSANSDTSSIASQKLGTATPSDAKLITPLSIQLRGRLAASMPSGTPTTSATLSAIETISKVLGRQRTIEVITGSPDNSDFDKSPCTAFHSQSPYCSRNARSSP